MKGKIRAIFDESKGLYGARRICAELRSRGFRISHKKVQRLMREMGLRGKAPKRKCHSCMGRIGAVADDLIARDFKADAPDRKWTTDVSQLTCPGSKAYPSPVLGMWNGEIVGWGLSRHPDFAQTNRMLDMAFRGRERLDGLIVHSDQGWQYQMKQCGERLAAMGIAQSMSRKGNCYGNRIMEGFFGRMKNEMFYGRESEFGTFEKLKNAIGEYIDYHNNRRIKSKADWMAPAKCREAYLQSQR